MRYLIILLATTWIFWSCGPGSNPSKQKELREFLIYSSSERGDSDLLILDLENGERQVLTQAISEEWAPIIFQNEVLTFLSQDRDSISRKAINLMLNKKFDLGHPANCLLDDKNLIFSPDRKWELYQCGGDIFVNEIEKIQPKNLTQA